MSSLFAQTNSVVMLVFAGTFITIALLAFAFFGRVGETDKQMRRRLSGLRERADLIGPDGEVAQLRRDMSDSSFATFDRLLKAIVPPPAQLRRKLARTGRRISLGNYFLTCILIGLVSGFIAHTFLHAPTAAAVLGGIADGVLLPYLAVSRMASKRMAKFLKQFPDAIDLIVRGLKSGLPATETIALVGQEVEDPVGIEFRTVTDSMKLGLPLEDALVDATERIPLTDFQFFVITLSVQKETGGNLTETLENLSNLLRRRQQMKMKIRAMSSEARASAYIIGSLPFILGGVIYMLNPEYVSLLFTDPRGQALLGVGLSWLTIGAGVMAKMVKFDI